MAVLDPALLAMVAALEERVGCSLGDTDRAVEALTHRSFAHEAKSPAPVDNERLEFLGDAVIGLAIRHRLMERCPGADEGTLSRLHSALVSGESLAQVARRLKLGELLRLGRGEERTGGREKSSLLADCFEAVLGAVYLTGGMPLTFTVVDRLFGEALIRAEAGVVDRDFKSDLNEVAQSLHRTPPRYQVAGEEGPDHSKVFTVEVKVDTEVCGRGSGRSKKDAEQAAARDAPERLAPAAAPPPPATPE